LASRGYGDFLVEQLKGIDTKVVDAEPLYVEYIQAISASREPAVRDQLFEIVKTTRSDAYFMAALPAVDRKHDAVVLESARRILAGLPEDTDCGALLLEMIGERFPAEARAVYKSFLAAGSAGRAETMCRVLWYGDPLSKEILAPLLDDKRPLPGFIVPMRVCDRAAQAISHTSESISFDSEWSPARKDRQIERIKQYCREAGPRP
ncbi:MAG: hypothetical protein KY475_23935, partial [Planctomycetes bacterium]|nr:hypothetical protein [Planctomycetota bacterium]